MKKWKRDDFMDLKDLYKDYKNFLNKDIEISGWIRCLYYWN